MRTGLTRAYVPRRPRSTPEDNLFGPILLEGIQRKGDAGFGDGAVQALFESIELDRMRRGVLPAAAMKAAA